MRAPGRLLPGRIATQLMLLVTLSALIFHLCMSGVFLLNRNGWFRPMHPALVNRLDYAVGVLEAAAPDGRAAVVDALARSDPALDIRPDASGAPAGPGRRRVALRGGAAVTLADTASRRSGPDPSVLASGTLVFIALSTTLFVVWAVRGVTAPLGRVAEAFDGVALDAASLAGKPRVLPETGATEIATVARGFNRMQARIARMMAERTDMLAAVSHDLRTPITRLRLRAEFVADPPLRELMLRDLGQMDALVHAALSFIRDRAVERVPARLDLASLLRTVCDEAADLGHRARYGGPDHLVIRGHEDELRRAVGNLVDNAARVEAEALVELSREADGTVAVTVSDDGPGIPPERLDEVMQPFRRGTDDGNRPQPSGFGLGLPIVQAIVAAHGGTLTLSNRLPHGLCCRIALPAA
ncbi:ATP-binding protein [Lichenibacterium ramalinae]|uniref:histidine kinase n=1 Tax=Lichenibacterium ramalinae TaxID=2316527 RepID=A0A4Q2RII5_9HYPH|nr:ATP-binding protein [Lichenibacterium ramalinae]RYB07804.1 HAMP domain-containing protein [Lichenibacterium ramalinae]